jgi:hypothetical protein
MCSRIFMWLTHRKRRSKHVSGVSFICINCFVRCLISSYRYQIYVRIFSNRWTLSRRKFPIITDSAARTLFASVTTPNGKPYALLPILPSSQPSVSVSDVFAIIVSRPIRNLDFSVFESSIAKLMQPSLSALGLYQIV